MFLSLVVKKFQNIVTMMVVFSESCLLEHPRKNHVKECTKMITILYQKKVAFVNFDCYLMSDEFAITML